MRKSILIILIILPVILAAQNWSWHVGNGGNPARNGQADGVLSSLSEDEVLWEGSNVFSYWPHQPFTEGNVIVADRTFNMNDVLHGTWIVAYDITSGDTLWTVDLPVYFPDTDWRSRVCGTNDGVVYATRSGNTNASYLHALDVTDGSIIWTSTELTDMSSGECVTFAENGDLIIGNFQNIMRLNASDGSLIWQETRYSPTSSGSEVSVYENHVYGWAASTSGPSIVVHDIETGAFLYESGGVGGGLVQQLGCFVGPDGIVYAPRTQNNVVTDSLVAFTDTGSELERMWQIGLCYIPFATFGVDLNGNVYSYNYDYQVIHIDSHSGDILNSSTRISNDIPNYRTTLFAGSIYPAKGEEKVRQHYFSNNREPAILDTSIVIGDPGAGIVSPHAAVDAEGYLYITNHQDKLFCFDESLNLIWEDTFDRPDGPALGMDGHLVICADSYEMKVYEGRGLVAPGMVFGNVTLIGGNGNVIDVEITTANMITNPDEFGFYSLELSPGTYSITASLDNYEPQTIDDVLVESGAPTGPIDFDLNAITSIDSNIVPDSDLDLNIFPNPFNPTTKISFNVPQTSSFAIIEIYNLKGQKVKTFSNLQITQSPDHQIIWNGTDQNNKPVSSGIYFARFKTEKINLQKKMLLLK
ncbi:MAG: PQQ-binding-like beta-propeller repeat protein [Candidatus Cloacimonetes bacterium]|nr:PQQ-binding-like beta-propeller repeat protein [Candidatus Cloacimonadota bacterium]MCF7812867.1 PQQ-binding-like beta-propeller repeat protein [Candidatus Cloacimonadota bacterium]MCF7867079.1 PQQ-binding-like beta-propeller repeat protein [Candidatus Cloacimonadota bacterium]MCF7882601.1 PQQ-binding-like beta-propeller repeat protein [Candidatus Cloacimonadota bacterium]